MTSSLEDEIQSIVTSMENDQENPEPEDTIHIHYFPDAIVILREEDQAQVIDSTPVIAQNVSFLPAYAICVVYIFLVLSCIAFQAYEILNPPIATVTIIPKSQTVTLTGTVKLGRLLQPLTISQSLTVPTTGKGHQDARSATGYITFYNGLFMSQTIQAGTILTGEDGIQIITDQDAAISAGNPPSYGQTTVSAHAISPGVRGNIPAYDISQACCSSAVLAKNTGAFTGGQDERTFQTVATKDIQNAAITLKTTLAQSVKGALQGQAKPTEQLFLLPCTTIQTSNHTIGDEATQVKVTVSETCSAVAYNSQELAQRTTDLLTHQAVAKLGTSYSLFGDVQVSVKQATVTHTNTPPVFLSFSVQGTWVYALSKSEQERLKTLITGKSRQEAMQILESLPGIERVSIDWGERRLPKSRSYIHISLFVQ